MFTLFRYFWMSALSQKQELWTLPLSEGSVLFQGWFTPRYVFIRDTAKTYRVLFKTGEVGFNIFCGPVHTLNVLYKKKLSQHVFLW